MNDTQNTAKIYLITRTKCFSASEAGTSFALHPWGNNTEYYEGYDDGGKEYLLPDGFEVAETNGGGLGIYISDENADCPIVLHSSGRPQVISLYHGAPVLKLAEG